MSEPDPWFEIIDFDDRSLTMLKKKGTWKYDLAPGEMRQSSFEMLAEHKREKWGTIGIATFERIPNGDTTKLKLLRIGC